MLCRQGLLTLCGSHTCLHVSLPTASVRPPEECTSISRLSVSFCIGHHPQTGTCWTDGLLSLLLPVPQGVPLFGGNGRCAVPMPEPKARRQVLKTHLRPQGQLPLRSELEAPPGVAILRQAWGTRQRPCRRLLGAQRESTCRGLSSFICSILLTDQWMAELIEAQRYLVPQAT